MLIGQNGILNRTQEATEKTEFAGEEELRKLTQMQAALNIEDTTHTDKSTGEEKTVTIPAGFAVSQVKGENTIEDGLVIIDADGNEFVWVPVDKNTFDTKFKRTEGYVNKELDTKIADCGEAGIDGENSKVTESNTTKQEAKAMYASVKQNGGFYIARYEAGKETVGGIEKVVSKKNKEIFNNIPWSTSDDMSIDTGGAVEKARKMATTNGYKGVASTLCYGVQWDATINFIDSDYITNETADGKPNCSLDSYVVDATGCGWYSDNYEVENPEHKTGVDLGNGSNKVKNIYDMAGNVVEWTMESYGSDTRIRRGGRYDDIGSSNSCSSRGSNYPTRAFEYIGFRIALYIK